MTRELFEKIFPCLNIFLSDTNKLQPKKIDRHVKYIDRKLEEYTEALSEADGDKTKEIKNKIISL